MNTIKLTAVAVAISLTLSSVAFSAITAQQIELELQDQLNNGGIETDYSGANTTDFLTTNLFDQDIGGWVRSYGSNQTVQISAEVFAINSINEVGGEFVGSLGITLEFFVNGDNGWNLRVADAAVNVEVDDATGVLDLTMVSYSNLTETVNKLGRRHSPTDLNTFVVNRSTELNSTLGQGFSSVGVVAVPEPSSAALLGLGAFGFLIRRRR